MKNRNLRGLCDRAVLAALAFSFTPLAAAAEPANAPFSGRWRMDTTSLKGNIKPTTIVMAKGFFARDSNPPIKADGKFHRVSGDGYVDETSILIVDDHTVREVDRVRGKLAYTVVYKVSEDSQVLTWHIASYTNPNAKAVEALTVQRRVGLAKRGSHPISGKWARVSVSVNEKSDWILKLNGRQFSWHTDYGTGYDAVIGGGPVRIRGDSSGARAVITRPRPDTIVETDLSPDGKRASVLTMRILPGGKKILGTAMAGHTKERTTFYLYRVDNPM